MKRLGVHMTWILFLFLISPAMKAETVHERIVPRTVEVTFPALDPSAVSPDQAARVDDILRAEAVALIAETAPFGSVTGGYEVHLDRDGLLSITLQYSGFDPSMAHPMHYRASATVDLEAGAPLALADLFSDASYVPVLSDIVRKEIETREIPLITDFTAISPEQDFYLTADALVLYFQLYEIAPYAWGFVEIEIPYASIAHLIHDQSPLRRLVARN